jgi:hypothetical protein
MIDDMASLKKAMEQMDSDDVAASQAAKDRAARILSDSKLSFSKMGELIEQRRLLLRPKIVASIKRMDQPEMLGDAAFRDAATSLRREGQNFRQIAEALELNSGPAPRNEEPLHKGDVLLHPMEMEGEPHVPRWLRALAFGTRIFFYPLRHPIRTFVIALIAFMLFNTYRGFVGVGRQVSGYVADVSSARQRADAAASSVSSFIQKLRRPSQDAASPPIPPAPIPSPSTEASATPSTGPTVASAPPAATPNPPANAAAPPANDAATPATPPTTPATPAAPTASTPRPDVRSGSPSTSAAYGRPRTVRPRSFDDLMPAGIRRNSRSGGPCIGGAGGCYWGGVRY